MTNFILYVTHVCASKTYDVIKQPRNLWRWLLALTVRQRKTLKIVRNLLRKGRRCVQPQLLALVNVDTSRSTHDEAESQLVRFCVRFTSWVWVWNCSSYHRMRTAKRSYTNKLPLTTGTRFQQITHLLWGFCTNWIWILQAIKMLLLPQANFGLVEE